MDRGQIYREITVLSLEQALALPYGAYRLVQEGMRVIRIEAPPRGDPNRYVRIEALGEHGMNSYFLSVNAGKESITLNHPMVQKKKFTSKDTRTDTEIALGSAALMTPYLDSMGRRLPFPQGSGNTTTRSTEGTWG